MSSAKELLLQPPGVLSTTVTGLSRSGESHVGTTWTLGAYWSSGVHRNSHEPAPILTYPFSQRRLSPQLGQCHPSSQCGMAVDKCPGPLSPLGSAAAAAAKSLHSFSTLCDPIEGSPPGSPVPGILQARTLEWVAVAFSASLGSDPPSQACTPLY